MCVVRIANRQNMHNEKLCIDSKYLFFYKNVQKEAGCLGEEYECN